MMTSTRIHCLIEDDEITVMPRCYESYCRENLMFSAGFILGYALSADLLDKPNLISPPNILWFCRPSKMATIYLSASCFNIL
ncbi:hypothetical protein NC651_013935 [Populus alba x Populus x berolinensis]|nr:hypothetical protein NC651_013935 [Populus alba x Populus x berolinensis]